MEIRADVELPFPRERVFVTYRDRLAELTEYLPNIQRIEVLKREESGDEIRLVNEWSGGGDIPKVARAVISESMLRWTDYATWHSKTFVTDWRSDVHAFPGAVKSSGQNRFLEIPSGTRLEIRGTLVCDSAVVPGVPKLFARTVNAAAERILVGQIGPNLVQVAKGVGKLLERDR